MSLKFSQGVVNSIASGIGWGDVVRNSIIKIYTGSQPSSPETGATGTLLATFTSNSANANYEARCIATVDLSNATGNLSSLTIGTVSIIGGAISYSGAGSNAIGLANAVAANINSTFTFPDYQAVVGGTVIGANTIGADADIVYVIAPKNSEATLNGLVANGAVAGGTLKINGGSEASSSSANIGVGGLVAGANANNCLLMSYPASNGMISKSGVWSANAVANGTAAWFRMLCTPTWDDGTTNLANTGTAANMIMRIDGTVGTSGADMLISSTTIVANTTQTITQFDLTVPAS